MKDAFAAEPASKCQANQKVEVILDPTDGTGPGTVRINGVPIDNIAAIGVHAETGDVDEVLVTIKLAVPASIFKMEIDQVKPSTVFNQGKPQPVP